MDFVAGVRIGPPKGMHSRMLAGSRNRGVPAMQAAGRAELDSRQRYNLEMASSLGSVAEGTSWSRGSNYGDPQSVMLLVELCLQPGIVPGVCNRRGHFPAQLLDLIQS